MFQSSVSSHLNLFSFPFPFPSSWLTLSRPRQRKNGEQRRESIRTGRNCCVYTCGVVAAGRRQAGAAFVHRECILLCRPYNFFFINHRSAELKRILETILLKRTPRCEERKEERRKYHLLRASHMLWIHGPRSHSQHVAELGPHST